jgi:hypothetical protein
VRVSAIRSIKAAKPPLGKPSYRSGSEWAWALPVVWKSCKRICPERWWVYSEGGQFGKQKPPGGGQICASRLVLAQGLGSSRAAGGAALTISDVEPGYVVSGLIISASPSA